MSFLFDLYPMTMMLKFDLDIVKGNLLLQMKFLVKAVQKV